MTERGQGSGARQNGVRHSASTGKIEAERGSQVWGSQLGIQVQASLGYIRLSILKRKKKNTASMVLDVFPTLKRQRQVDL